ncbi:MAG: CRISPR-associated helicase Cas3' [Candidatus Bathyarchaeia archaeon]
MEAYAPFKLLARPNQWLYDHLKGTAELSEEIVKSKNIDDRDRLARLSYLTGFCHDFGKGTTYFQSYLNNSEKTEKARHSLLSSIFAYYVVKREMCETDAVLSSLAVMKHHTDLQDLLGTYGMKNKIIEEKGLLKQQIDNLKQNSLAEMNKIYESIGKDLVSDFLNAFDSTLNEMMSIRNGNFWKALKEDPWKVFFEFMFIYSVLLDADKLNAAELSLPKYGELRPDMVDAYIKNFDPKSPLFDLRNEAYNEVVGSVNDIGDKRILTIELPTGSGKTLAGLSLALKLREKIKGSKGFAPKIIYTLPYLSIIDQVQREIEKVLTGVGGKELCVDETHHSEIPTNLMLVHHHLSDLYYKDEDTELEPEKAELLVEDWHSSLVLTTSVQLFQSIITNKKKAIRKLHNMSNSIIILDEIQTIEYEYWDTIREFTEKLARTLNSWVIVMTATQPFIFTDVKQLIREPARYYKRLNRVDFSIGKKKIKVDELIQGISDTELKMGDMMIVVNTVKSAQDIYLKLKERLKKMLGEPTIDDVGIANFGSIEMIYLSTHIVPKQRRERICRIKEDKVAKLIVSTQLIEAGVDISVKRLIRDLAPIDSIVQAAGRCNRNNDPHERGMVSVVQMIDDNEKLFADKIYGGTLASISWHIINGLPDKVNETDFVVEAIKKYYEQVHERGKGNDCFIKAVSKFAFSELRDFSLIKEEPYKSDVFVEADDSAVEIFEKYKKLKLIKDLKERKEEFNTNKRRFYDYVINVKVDEKLSEEQGLFVIRRNELDVNYDREIGYKLEEKDDDIYL